MTEPEVILSIGAFVVGVLNYLSIRHLVNATKHNTSAIRSIMGLPDDRR